MKWTFALNEDESGKRLKEIRDINSRGLIVKMKNRLTGTIKLLNDVTIDENGDMRSMWTNGNGVYVCWNSPEYEVSSITEKEAQELIKENTK